jgi:hypothetical protein
MSTPGSVDFNPPIEITPHGLSAGYRIASTGQLAQFVADQLSVWEPMGEIPSSRGGLSTFARALAQKGQQIMAHALALEKLAASSGLPTVQNSDDNNLRQIKKHLNSIQSGDFPIRDSIGSARAIELMKTDLIAAASLLYIERTNAIGELGQLADGTPNALVLRGLVAASSTTGLDEFVASSSKAFHKSRVQADQDLADFRLNREAEISRQAAFWTETEKAVGEHEASFVERLKALNEEWENLKRVYDEKLALLAPTTYWESKQVRHRWFAIGYGATFILSIGIGLACFVAFGVSVLSAASTQAATGTAYVPRLLEVLIPAFLGIWILRILGRMLATHLQLWEEARERLTMLRTFLALMRDEKRGALVKDEDRILILSALFRHSGPSTVDDAPPATWFDILMTRIKSDKA